MGWHSRMKPYLAGTVQPCPILLPLYQTTRPSITYLAQWHSGTVDTARHSRVPCVSPIVPTYSLPEAAFCRLAI